MLIHNFSQGSEEWHAFRKNMFNASECAAMLGISSKVTRNELLRMKKTGTEQQFSEWVQKNVLDYGHEVEALARPIVEKIIGEPLYPVTCSDGKFSASCDGLTMGENIAFEHKQLNERLKQSLRNGDLPEEYMPQCQQILMITGAEYVVFVASDGTEENMITLNVLPDESWFERISAGWDQFEKDMETYEHVELDDKPIAGAIMQLPALVVRTRGEVLESNLGIYKEAATKYIASINTDLRTDDDFANAESTVKFCENAEKTLEQAKSATIAQASSIEEVLRTIGDIQEQLRSKRLSLEKLVKTRKESIKNEIIQGGIAALKEHVDALEYEISPIKLPKLSVDFHGAAKNKRTLSSLKNAIDTELASAKIEADSIAKDIRSKIAWKNESAVGFEFLFSDIQTLIQKPFEDFQLAITSRIENHKKVEEEKAEAQRKQIQAEEQAKAEAKVRAEQASIELKKQKESVEESYAPSAPAKAASEPVISIPLKEYEQLLEDSAILRALRHGGLESWDCYDEIMILFREQWEKESEAA